MSHRKILLVDDVELFLELEKTFFNRAGFQLLVARTGQEAYDLAVSERPDLIFMDLFMPQMNGDEACRLLKADPALAAIPVVMVTQGGHEEELRRCRQAGCNDI
ncbi:MAG TPA: response regulator, partial [Desulfuromonadales bacterium]|nr:response regulator [Desulfuromonadales bacterium]